MSYLPALRRLTMALSELRVAATRLPTAGRSVTRLASQRFSTKTVPHSAQPQTRSFTPLARGLGLLCSFSSYSVARSEQGQQADVSEEGDGLTEEEDAILSPERTINTFFQHRNMDYLRMIQERYHRPIDTFLSDLDAVAHLNFYERVLNEAPEAAVDIARLTSDPKVLFQMALEMGKVDSARLLVEQSVVSPDVHDVRSSLLNEHSFIYIRNLLGIDIHTFELGRKTILDIAFQWGAWNVVQSLYDQGVPFSLVDALQCSIDRSSLEWAKRCVDAEKEDPDAFVSTKMAKLGSMWDEPAVVYALQAYYGKEKSPTARQIFEYMVERLGASKEEYLRRSATIAGIHNDTEMLTYLESKGVDVT